MIDFDDALDMWRKLNDKGRGYPAGEEGQDPLRAAIEEGWEVLETGHEGSVLCRIGEGAYAMICDVDGPWVCSFGNRLGAKTR